MNRPSAAESAPVAEAPLAAEAVPLDAEIVDLAASAPQGVPCEACGCPVEPGDRFCPACGTPQETAAPPVAAPPPPPVPTATTTAETASVEETESAPIAAETVDDDDGKKHFRCQTCGAEVTVDADHRSFVCPFCDSTYVVEFSRAASHRQPPEFVIGFAVTREQALEKFRTWLQNDNLLRPGDLTQQAQIEEKLTGVYLPFWSFSLLAESNWSASIGEHWYRTETYTTTDAKGNTVTRTRQVQETEWWPLSGQHHRFYSGYMVSGSKGLPQAEAERIKPFQLPALKRYEPYYLAGWVSEEYSIDRDDALRISQEEFYRRENGNIKAFLPGDTHRQVNVSTRFSQINSDLCLLPVYILRYRYKDKLYRFLVNGQTGKLAGDKPFSGYRLALLIGLIGLGVAAVAIVIALIGGLLAR